MNTPQILVRIEPALIDAVRARFRQEGAIASVVIRAALMMMADPDLPPPEAFSRARLPSGPKRAQDA